MDDETRGELQDVREQLTIMKLTVGILLGALRAFGHLESSEQKQILDAMSGMISFVPTIEPSELKRHLTIVALAAETITVRDGKLTT